MGGEKPESGIHRHICLALLIDVGAAPLSLAVIASIWTAVPLGIWANPSACMALCPVGEGFLSPLAYQVPDHTEERYQAIGMGGRAVGIIHSGIDMHLASLKCLLSFISSVLLSGDLKSAALFMLSRLKGFLKDASKGFGFGEGGAL